MVSPRAFSSLACTATGMPRGPTTMPQLSRTAPGKPDSANVGTAGSNGERFAVVIAMALTLPALICGAAAVTVSKEKGTWPPITSVMAGPLPL